MGKKGLGKLSVFGICDTIEVVSVKNGLKNHFKMNLEDIRNSQGEYEPEIVLKNEQTDDEKGTILYLKNIRRKSAFDLDKIALSISKKFLIFDEMKTSLYLNESNEIPVTNDLKFRELKTQFEWTFPDKKYESEYEHWKDIQGTIFTLETPVKDTEMRGLYLTSRGKIVNTADFYGARDNDQFHSYVTGYLEVDFIDDFDEDVISTDRHSLNWENE
ncbi:MAG: ATP-binding protein, partial [Lentisphaeria bacterium]|nr:ATP-binding protein [Lentisphaeria bacterium]